MKITAYRFSKLKYIEIEENIISKEFSIDSDTKQKQFGRYDIINTKFLAIFSRQNKNYILFEQQLHELNDSISITYHCEQSKEERSWIKIYKKGDLILDIDYKNNQEPFNNPFDGFEDWGVVNFAYHLAEYINKVRENPNIVLFPNE